MTYRITAALGAVALALTSTSALACACGCGVFDLGGATAAPTDSDSGLTVWLRFSAIDQSRNQNGAHPASPDANEDKRILTHFYTLGGEYMLNRSWSVMAQLPLTERHFTTEATNDSAQTAVATFPLTDLGDLMVKATYTGFAPDMSSGVSLGLKLPTGRTTSPTYGSYTQNPPYDRDTVPGTGSTDLLLGAYHLGHLGGGFSWFAQAQYQFALASRGGYRPGNEADGALGVSYAIPTGGQGAVMPMVQLIGSLRAHDTGTDVMPNTGYQRLLIAPGVKWRLTRKLSLYGDVELPLAQYVNVDTMTSPPTGQLVAPLMVKLQVSYGL